MGGVRWTEVLSGPLSFDQIDFNQAMQEGLRDGVQARLELTLQVDDVTGFAAAETKTATVTSGVFDAPGLDGPLRVLGGEFQQYVQADELLDHLHLRMRYRLRLRNAAGEPLRVEGFKVIENDPGYDSWADTTTLFTRVRRGWRAEPGPGDPPAASERALATAVLQISPLGFLRELTTFTGTAPDRKQRGRDLLRFGTEFAKGLAKAYVGPPIEDGTTSFPRDRPWRPWHPDPARAWHAVPGRERPDGEARPALEREVIRLPVAELAFPLTLHHLRRTGQEPQPDMPPVLMVHGAGVRAEMFYGQPRRLTIADALLAEGYDVWALNWRGSIDLPNVSYTLDQVARIDHPAAIRAVHERTGAARIRALVHCQGSVSFLMAAVAGLLPRHPVTGEELVSHVVSSAISLFFECSDRTWLKQRAVLPLVGRVATGADPQWGIRSFTPAGAGLAAVARRCERPCGNVPCQIANYIYGAGWDVLLCHDNIDDEVHQWTARELGYTPVSLISQVAESHRNGHIVPAQPISPGGPATYVGEAPAPTGIHFTLLGCGRDAMFLPRGQRRTVEYLQANNRVADYVELPFYGHMDAYWGPRSCREVFPSILHGLDWNGRDETAPHLRRADQQPVIAPPERLSFTSPPVSRSRAWAPPAVEEV